MVVRKDEDTKFQKPWLTYIYHLMALLITKLNMEPRQSGTGSMPQENYVSKE
jgi:hypothetical protein